MQTFISILIFIGTFLSIISYIRIKNGFSTYGFKRMAFDTLYEHNLYYNCYQLKENDLYELYDREKCDSIVLSFDEFCLGIWQGKKVLYE